MRALSQILVATDLSAPALWAVHRGFLLARQSGARYCLMHALPTDALRVLRGLLDGDRQTLTARLIAAARAELADLAADPRHSQGVAADIHLAEGAALKAVTAQAEALDADLVVLGARGGGLPRHLLPGSTAASLVRKLCRPVLLVKQPARAAYRRVLAPIDFSAVSGASVQAARVVAPDAALVLLHAVELPFEGKLRFAGIDEGLLQHYLTQARQDALARLHELAASCGLGPDDYHAVALSGNAGRQIALQEQEHECDLIVIGKHGQHVTEELLLGSVTQHVLAESHADVLVLPASG